MSSNTESLLKICSDQEELLKRLALQGRAVFSVFIFPVNVDVNKYFHFVLKRKQIFKNSCEVHSPKIVSIEKNLSPEIWKLLASFHGMLL